MVMGNSFQKTIEKITGQPFLQPQPTTPTPQAEEPITPPTTPVPTQTPLEIPTPAPAGVAQTTVTSPDSGVEQILWWGTNSPDITARAEEISDQKDLVDLLQRITNNVLGMEAGVSAVDLTPEEQSLLAAHGIDFGGLHILNPDDAAKIQAIHYEESLKLTALQDAQIADIQSTVDRLREYSESSSGAQYFQDQNGEKVLNLDELYATLLEEQDTRHAVGLHTMTGEEIMNRLKGLGDYGEYEAEYDWDTVRTLLLNAGLNNEDTQYIIDMLSYDVQNIIASWEQMIEEMKGVRDIYESKASLMSGWDKFLFTISRPFTALHAEVVKPVAGAVALLFTGDIFDNEIDTDSERAFYNTLARLEKPDDNVMNSLLNYKEALKASQEERPMWWQIVGETIFDPTTYIGFSAVIRPGAMLFKNIPRFGQAAQTIARTTPRLLNRPSNRIGLFTELMVRAKAPVSIGRLSNTLELGFQDLMELPFVKAKIWYSTGAKVGGKLIGQPGKVTALAIKSEKQIVQAEARRCAMSWSGYALQAARTSTRAWIPSSDSCAAALHDAIDMAIANPYGGGNAASVGKDILNSFSDYFTADEFSNWAEAIGNKVKPSKVSSADLARISQALELTPGMGTVPKAFRTEKEIAALIASDLLKGTDITITDDILELISKKIRGRFAAVRDSAKTWVSDTMDKGARRFAGEAYSKVYHSLAGFPKDGVLGKVGSDVFAHAYRQGVIGSMVRRLDPRCLRTAREALEKNIVMPFAKSYLLFTMYGPMNYIETWFKGGLAGGGWRFKVDFTEVERLQRNWNHLSNRMYDLSTFVPRKGFIKMWKQTPESVRVEMLKTRGGQKTLVEKIFTPRFLEVPLIELQSEFGMQRLAYTINNWMFRQLEELAPETCNKAYSILENVTRANPEIKNVLKRIGVSEKEFMEQFYEQILVDTNGIPSIVGKLSSRNISANNILQLSKKYRNISQPFKELVSVMVEDGEIYDMTTLMAAKKNIAQMLADEYALSPDFWSLKYKNLAAAIRKEGINSFSDLTRTIQNLNELVLFQDQTVFYLERNLAREVDMLGVGADRHAIYKERELAMADFLKSSGESIDNIISDAKSRLWAFDMSPEQRSSIEALLEVQSQYWKSIEAVRTKVWEFSNKAFEITPKAARDNDWWSTFRYKRAKIWEDVRPYHIESMADMTSLYDTFAGVTISALPDVRSGVTPHAISQLWGTNIEGVYKNLFDQNFGVVMPKDAFIAYNLNRAMSIAKSPAAKRKGVDPIALGWTEQAIGEAYDTALRNLKIDPENFAFDAGRMMEFDSMFSEISAVIDNSALPGGALKTLRKFADDVRIQAEEIPGLRKPVIQKKTVEDIIPAEPSKVIQSSTYKAHLARLDEFVDNQVRAIKEEIEQIHPAVEQKVFKLDKTPNGRSMLAMDFNADVEISRYKFRVRSGQCNKDVGGFNTYGVEVLDNEGNFITGIYGDALGITDLTILHTSIINQLETGWDTLYSQIVKKLPKKWSRLINDIRYPRNAYEDSLMERAHASWFGIEKEYRSTLGTRYTSSGIDVGSRYNGVMIIEKGQSADSLFHELCHVHFSHAFESRGLKGRIAFANKSLSLLGDFAPNVQKKGASLKLWKRILIKSGGVKNYTDLLDNIKSGIAFDKAHIDDSMRTIEEMSAELFQAVVSDDVLFASKRADRIFKNKVLKNFNLNRNEIDELRSLIAGRSLDDLLPSSLPDDIEYMTPAKPERKVKKVVEERVGTTNSDEWNTIQETAMREVRNKNSRVFADYDPTNQNILDEFARSVFPFWTYQTHRWTWMAENFAKHPGMYFFLERYEKGTDRGYIRVPGTDIEFNPFRGTIFGNLVTRLTQRDYPEYYDTAPWLSQIEDTMGRYGFYPGSLVSIPMTIWGAKEGSPQWGTLLPTPYKTLIGAIEATFPDTGETLREIFFPDYFRDYQIILAVNQAGGRGDIIWSKKHENIPLTEEEQAIWDEAGRKTAGLQVIFEQAGMFRFRPEEMIKAYETTAKVIEQYTGITVQQQEDLRNNGMRVTDIIPLSPQVSNILNSLESVKSWTGMTLPLMPTELQYDSARRELFWYDVDEKNKEFDALQADWDRRFLHREVTANQWLAKSREIGSSRAQYIDDLKSTSYYENVPVTTEEMEAWYARTGRVAPLMHPERELMNLYYTLTPSEYLDPETGTWSTDWDSYYAQVDLIFDLLPDNLREQFISDITRNWSPMRKLYWEVNREYIRPYRNRFDLILNTFSDEDQSKIRNYYAATSVSEREYLNQDEAVQQFKSMYTQAGARLREISPTLDAWLNFFGTATSFKTVTAREEYNRICAELGMTP